MKKVDLLNLIKDLADDGDINEIILGADEFKDLGKVDLSKLTVEEVKSLLETNEAAKGYLTSHDDSIRSTAVETFKNGKMKEEIKKAVEEAKNGKKTPEQEALEKLQKEFEASQAELAKERTMSKLSKNLKEKQLPIELADFAYGDGQEETINKNIETLQGILNNAVDSGVKAKLGTNSYTPPADTQTNALNAQIANAMGVQ